MAYYKIGVCNWFLNNKDEVENFFKSSEDHVKEQFDHDKNAMQWIEKYRSNGNIFTKYDEWRIILDNLMNLNLFERSSDYLQAFRTSLENEEDLENEIPYELECWLNYYNGLILSGMKDHDQAIEVLRTNVLNQENKLKDKYMFYVIPYSYVEIADNYHNKNDEDNAMKMYKKAKTYTNYAFEKYLNYRIVRALESMKEISKPQENE